MPRSRRRLRGVVVGASAGGFDALGVLLEGLAAGFRPPLILLLHSAADDHESLARHYAARCVLPVQEAQEREKLKPGRVYVAPPGYHLLIERNERLALSVDERVCFSRPSIDVLFEAAADVWTRAAVGVVLTGANEDGARGLRAIRERGGTAIVQSPDDAAMPTMPAAALRLAGADHVVPLAAIAPLLNRLAGAAA